MTPAEKDEYETLLRHMGEAVISFPTLEPSHNVEYDTFFDTTLLHGSSRRISYHWFFKRWG